MLNLLEDFVELFFYLKIMIAPIIFGIIIAILLLFWIDNVIGNILSFITVIASIFGGFQFANRMKKKHGASNFYSKVNESKDLNEL